MSTVFSGLSALVIDDVQDAGKVICVRARTRDQAVACPGCGTATTRVHGYHERTAADVPVDGRRVLVKVRARRMRRVSAEEPLRLAVQRRSSFPLNSGLPLGIRR